MFEGVQTWTEQPLGGDVVERMNDWTKKSLASPELCIVYYYNHTETLKSMVGTQINKINVLSRYSIQLSKVFQNSKISTG